MKKMQVILLIVALSLLPATPVFADLFQGVNYTVIEKSNILNIKSSIDIRLEEKVSKDFLKKLALKLRKADPRQYERMFITYYLPGMTKGSGAWAITHFDPNLEVKILGTTLEEEKALINDDKGSSGEIIGVWLDETPYIGAKYTFLRRNGKIIMIPKFKNGSSSEKEMIQKKQSGMLRFEKKEGNNFGEYYLIERDGNLGVYDNEGFIKTMSPIK